MEVLRNQGAPPLDRIPVAQGRILASAIEAGLVDIAVRRKPISARRALDLYRDLIDIEEHAERGDAERISSLSITSRRPLQLVAYEPTCVPAVRRDARFAGVLERLATRPVTEAEDFEAADEQADIEERREILEVLLRGEPVRSLPAIDSTASFYGAPLVLLDATIELPFNEVDAMWATLAALTARGERDAENEPLAKCATELGQRRSSCSAPLVEGMTSRLAARFDRRGPVERAALGAEIARALVGARSRQQRTVFGSDCVRGLWHASDASSEGIPIYIPMEFAGRLPSLDRLDVRVLVEVHPAIDAYETETRCLRAVALAIAGAAAE